MNNQTNNREVARVESQVGVLRYVPHFLVLGTYLLMGVRFFHLISQYAVNVLFWDPWDFDDATLFQQHSIWEMFRWQHGWHRQGLGALLQKLIEPRIHWNGRYEAFFLGAVIVAVAVLALPLKMRLYGAIGCSDVIIPLLFLTPLQYEALVWSPNPSQCSLPLLLAIAPDGSLLLQLVNPHLSLEVHLHFAGDFFLIYTGFGIFMGPVTPALLALDYYGNTRRRARKYRCSTAAALAISIASLASIFVHYKWTQGVDCRFPSTKYPVADIWFVALMFANAAGLKILSLAPATLIGSLVLLLFVAGLFITFKRLLAQKSDTWPRDAAIAALMAYSAIFCLNASYARMCLGLAAAGNSRYTSYVILGLFGLYLYALSNRRRDIRVSLVLALLVFALLGARPLNRKDTQDLEHFSFGKRDWRECYLAQHDIYECDVLTHFQIHPHPEETHLQQKLDFLERNHLNLYDNSQ